VSQTLSVNEYIELKLTHSIHTSERLSFRACRRRWDWLFRDRWYPRTTAKPLEFGSAFHKGLEQWYDPIDWNKDPETREALAILAFANETTKQKNEYLKNNDGQIDPTVEEDYAERVELGKGMLHYHCTTVSPKVDASLQPLRVEIEFEVPVLADQEDKDSVVWCKCDQCWRLWKNSDTGIKHHDDLQTKLYNEYSEGLVKAVSLEDTWTEDAPQTPMEWSRRFFSNELYRDNHWKGLPVTFGGRIDCLMEDEYGRWWITDWKTTARLSGQEEGDAPDEFIQLDDQITGYCWALWSLGIPIAGFIHHEIKKAFPVEPEPNKQRRLNAWYSVNRQQNTSYDLYLETVREGDPSGYASGAYDEFLDWLKREGPRFYSRKQVSRSTAELANAGRNIYLEAMEMIRPDLPIYPSPGRFGCTFCAYRQPCIGTNRDEDVEYMFLSNFEYRERRYWETTPPSTDSKGGQ
jgi:hypothetical protein